MIKYWTILVLLIGHSVYGQHISNGYYHTPGNPYEYYSLEIQSDSTCVYREETCISSLYAEGKYKIDNNQLVIRFLVDTSKGYAKIDRKPSKATDSVTLHLSAYRKKDKSRLKEAILSFKENGN